MDDVYQVTIWLGHSRDRVKRWREYGRAGLTVAVGSVDWEIRNGHGTCGTVERLNSSGAVAVEVYRRDVTPAPSGSTSDPTRHSTPAPARSMLTPATATPPAPDLHPGGVIRFMNH